MQPAGATRLAPAAGHCQHVAFSRQTNSSLRLDWAPQQGSFWPHWALPAWLVLQPRTRAPPGWHQAPGRHPGQGPTLYMLHARHSCRTFHLAHNTRRSSRSCCSQSLSMSVSARCLPTAAGCRAARVVPFVNAQRQQAHRRLSLRVRSEDVSAAAAAPASTPAAVAALFKELDLSLDDYRRAPASVVSASCVRSGQAKDCDTAPEPAALAWNR